MPVDEDCYIAASVRLSDLQHGELTSEGYATLGIDIQSARLAPRREFVGIDYCSIDEDAFGLPLALLGLSILFPSGISGRKNMTVDHYLEDSRVILFMKPTDTVSSNSGIKHRLDSLEIGRL
jgi:hypothetical protein